MITQNEQKKMLIESMKKLTSHVSGNQLRQREIFDALSFQDFNKIINNLKDENEYLRRISALLLCQLFYRNDHTKARLVSLLSIQPKWGRICLGNIPETIYKYPSTLKKCVQLMHGQFEQNQEDKICWLINLQRKTLKLQFLEYKKYSTFTFVDPANNIFGVTIRKSNKISDQKIAKSPEVSKKATFNPDHVYKRTYKNSSQKMGSTSIQYYKQLAIERQKQSQSFGYDKKPLNSTMNIYHNEKASIGSSQSPFKNQLSDSINIPKRHFNVSLELKPNNADLRLKFDGNNTTRSNYQGSLKDQGRELSQYVVQLPYSHHKPYSQEMGTGRLNSQRLGNTGNPHSARSSLLGDKERFYKRVQQILKR